MALPINFANTVYQAGYFGTDNGGAPTNATHSFQLDDTYTFPVTVNGTVTGPSSTVTITYTVPGATAPTTQTLTATPYDNSNMILFIGQNGVPGTEDGSTNRFVFSNVPVYGATSPMRTTFADDGNSMVGNYTPAPPVCFARGTRILAARDGLPCEIAVEDLRIGDLVITASGAHRPIVWIGRRSYSGVFANRNPDVLPIRFMAGSLDEGVPSRELAVSPKPAMVLDDMLVAAELLVNGRTIVKAERVDRVEYFHVELDTHDVLVAEGAHSESYVEDRNRNVFQNADDFHAANPGAACPEAAYCLPRVEDGFGLEAVRRHLSNRADVIQGPMAEGAVRAA